MQIHRDNMITACRLQHIGDQFRRYRCSALVLFILACVGEVRYHGCDSAGRGGLAGVDHDEEFHKAVVDVAGRGGLEDEDCKRSEHFESVRSQACESIEVLEQGSGTHHLHPEHSHPQ
jgi:hypothetical protein